MSRNSRGTSRLIALAMLIAMPAAGMAGPDPASGSEKDPVPAKAACTAHTAERPIVVTSGLGSAVVTVVDVRTGRWVFEPKPSPEKTERPAVDVSRKKSRTGNSPRRRARRATPPKPKPDPEPFVELIGDEPDQGS